MSKRQIVLDARAAGRRLADKIGALREHLQAIERKWQRRGEVQGKARGALFA